jgi:hypothetical protein
MARSELPEKNLIIDEWDRWAKNTIPVGQRANELKALSFYRYLKDERSTLLDFPFAGDRWAIVKIWLRQSGRIFD